MALIKTGSSRIIENNSNTRNMFSYYMLLPSILFITFVNLYPFISGFIYSFKDVSMLRTGPFVGVQNYLELFKMGEFWSVMRFSTLFAVIAVVGSYIIGLSLALLLNMDIPGRGILRSLYLLPWITPSIVSMVSWKWLLNSQDSLVNVLLGYIGIKPILFLSTMNWSVFTVCMIKIWRSFPFIMISLLSSLQSISPEYYEAAYIDGVGKFKAFWYITLPHLKQISLVLSILLIIWSFNDFDTLWLLTLGGPSNATQNLILMAYKYAFAKNNMGIGSALCMIIVVILSILTVIMLRNRDETT
jgi:ABC-type sugar transport system permease subunit